MNNEAPLGKGGKITIRTVAKDAGVSVAAVSKVLRNAYGVSDELRGKVLKSIEKLGYRPNTAARGMRGKTYCVGVLLVDMSNPFLPSVVGGFQEVMRQNGYQALIGVGEAQAAIEQTLIDSMIDLQMDGVLLIAPRLSGDRLARFATQTPMVVIGHHEAAATAFDTVNSDDAAGARLAVEALVAEGHRDVHMISLAVKDSRHDVFAVREEGYLAAMRSAGLSERSKIWRLRERPDQPGEPLESFLDAPDRPSAVFCWSDMAAVDLLEKAVTRGLSVPSDLALVGYDNTTIAGHPLIGLSSIDQDGSRIGRAAAKALLSRISGRGVSEHILVAPRLERRTSLGKSCPGEE